LTRLLGGEINYPGLFLGAVLLTAGFTDLVYRKVPNWLTYPSLLAAVFFHIAALGWLGLGFSLAGLLVGGLVFFPAFWVGGMGAGDIKLMAVVGAFLGWKGALNAAVDAAVIGGIFAILFLWAKGELLETLHRTVKICLPARFRPHKEIKTAASYALPYAVFISLGAAATFFLPVLNVLP
jgi:prepilin peptidase CpaA